MKIKNIFFSILFLTTLYSNSASIGSVTIDGNIYNQISMRPEFEFGKVRLGLDLYFYIDDEGSFYDKSWDFSNGKALETLVDKIYFLSYNNPNDNFYFRFGGMPSVSLGYGILVNNYSNTFEYPNVRRLGIDLRFKSNTGISSQIIVSDLKRTPGMLALRTSFPLASRLKIGVFAITDLDMSSGLTDSDDDGYPDYFDDFPNDEGKNNDAWETYQENPEWWNTNVSGIIDCNSNVECIENILEQALPESFNSFDPSDINKDNISAIGLDLRLKLTKKISIYSQFAQMIGDELVFLNNDAEYKGNLGWGAIPVGLEFSFGPDKFKLSTNLEYRMNDRHFMYNFWDQTYELNRAQISSNSEVVTKRNQLQGYGELKGLYFGFNLAMMNLVDFNMSYQNMNGETWNSSLDITGQDFVNNGYFEDQKSNRSFLATLKFNTSRIPKLKVAELYYERNNDSDPFDFDNPSTNTVHGYNLGYELSDGVILLYKGRTTYVNDLNNPGEVVPNFSLQFETQIAI